MRKLLTWIVVTLGIAALVRKLRRRGAAPDVAGEESAGEDPADELRRKLAETREDENPGSDTPGASAATIEDRRNEVHEQGRAAIDEMQRSTED